MIETFLRLMRSNRDDLLAIEKIVGGLGGLIALEPALWSLWQLYQSGGIVKVLSDAGGSVGEILKQLGPDKITQLMPYAANIYKTFVEETKARSQG